MNRVLLVTISFFTLSFTLCAQSPRDILKPKVWLRADAGNNTPTVWTDVSGNKHDGSALNGEGPSISIGFNFNKAMLFDGVNDYLKIPYSLERTAELSVLSVFHSNDTTERGIWGIEKAVARNIMLTTRKAYGPDTLADNYGKSENRAVLNSLVQNWDKTVVTDSSAYLALGSTGKTKSDKPFNGTISELIIFDRALTFLERVQYETYLAIKYGTSLKGQNYVSSAGKLLWNASDNKGYAERLAGIGKDNWFSLNQKQSHSAYDSGFVTMSLGPLANSNTENNTTINDQDFVLWGDNGLPLSSKRGIGADSVLSMVQRKWLVTVTGTTANKLSTDLYIDVAKLPAEPLGYWLVIDRSGQSNFSVDNLEYILADRISNGKVIYKNVTWDKDGSGKDNFGFARAQEFFAIARTLKAPLCTDETAGKISIEVVAGKAPFQYTLTSKANSIERTGGIADKTKKAEQDELKAGDYVLKLKDGNSDEIVRNFSMKMPDALYIDVGQDRKLTDNNQVILDATPSVPDSVAVDYLWQNNFGFNSTQPKITVTESGIYRVTVTRKRDGCAFSDEVGVSGTEEQRLLVYPTLVRSSNPFNISVSLPKDGRVTVHIDNSQGVQLQEINSSGQSEYQFVVTAGNAGIYLIVIQTPYGMETKKVMVY